MTNTAKSLQAFLRSKAAEDAEDEGKKAINWEEMKNLWLSRVSDLYDTIKQWLAPLEHEVLEFKPSKMTVVEDYIGAYEADVLTIQIGAQEVSFFPKGTLIVGAEGRVDIRGPRAIRTIIFNEGKWRLVERTSKLKVLPFNEDSFRDILTEIME